MRTVVHVFSGPFLFWSVSSLPCFFFDKSRFLLAKIAGTLLAIERTHFDISHAAVIKADL